jgi:hypothetical protein
MGERRTPGYIVRTSKVGLGPPRVQAGPLEWDLDPPPPVWGPSHPQWGPEVPGQNILGPGTRPRRGSGADTCPNLDLFAYTPAPRLGVTPRIFAVEFFLFFTRQNSGVTFPFSFSLAKP